MIDFSHSSASVAVAEGHPHRKLRTVISGSYRRHLREVYDLRAQVEAHDILVLSPTGHGALNPEETFVVLDADPIRDPRTLQDSVFAKIRQSSFLTVANVDGYIGLTVALEIGFAIGLGLQILTLEPVDDPNLAPYTRSLWDVLATTTARQVERS